MLTDWSICESIESFTTKKYRKYTAYKHRYQLNKDNGTFEVLGRTYIFRHSDFWHCGFLINANIILFSKPADQWDSQINQQLNRAESITFLSLAKSTRLHGVQNMDEFLMKSLACDYLKRQVSPFPSVIRLTDVWRCTCWLTMSVRDAQHWVVNFVNDGVTWIILFK